MMTIRLTRLASSLLAISLLFGAGVCRGQLRPPGLSVLSADVQIDKVPNEAHTHLERAAALLSEGEFVEATETLMSLTEEYGDRLIALPSADGGDFQRYVPLRRFVHWRLATLPSEQSAALVIYRQRVDELTRRWYESARANRDTTLLVRIVEEFFPSTVGDDALWLLGELALDAGHYNAARRYWESLHSALRAAFTLEDKRWRVGVPIWMVADQAERSAGWDQVQEELSEKNVTVPWLVYPDTDKSLAEIRARLTLVSILEGARQRAKCELDILRRTAPKAVGILAGRSVNYVDALSELFVESDRWPAHPAPMDWTTFAGSFTRQHIFAGITQIHPQPSWRRQIKGHHESLAIDLQVEREFGVPASRAGESSASRLRSIPVVHKDTVYVADGDRVRAFSISTGASASPVAEDGEIYPLEAPPPGRPIISGRLGTPRFTMSIADHCVFTRLGSPLTMRVARNSNTQQSAPGYLVGIDTHTHKLVFRAEPEDGSWSFDGAPVAGAAKVYVVMRHSSVTPELHVACFDSSSQELQWRTMVCAAQSLGRGQVDEVTHTLLTMDDDTIYVNSNLGIVAAIDRNSGRMRWATRYPRAGAESANAYEPAWHVQRDLNPCLLHQSVLYTAPTDCEPIFAIDATTGQLIWQTQFPAGTLDAVHLLGIAGNHLIAAGKRLWWIDRRSGELSSGVADNPFPPSGRADVVGIGRGVLTGTSILWPVRGEEDGIVVIDQQTGRLVSQPIWLGATDVSAGHLVVGRDRLLVASSEELVALPIVRGAK